MMSWRDWFDVEILVPFIAVAIFAAQCGAWMAHPDPVPRGSGTSLDIEHLEEWERRELSMHVEQQTVLMRHLQDVEQWCDWVDREPAITAPRDLWDDWLDEALPIYLFTFGRPSICDLPRHTP